MFMTFHLSEFEEFKSNAKIYGEMPDILNAAEALSTADTSLVARSRMVIAPKAVFDTSQDALEHWLGNKHWLTCP